MASLNEIYDKIIDGEISSCIFFMELDLEYLNTIFNPILLSIRYFYDYLLSLKKSFTKQEEKVYSKNSLPKITFLNLDGFDSGFNQELIKDFRNI